MKPGRKSLPTEQLKIHGTFRADRHAARADVTPPSGEPVKPSGFTTVEAALWDQVVPGLAERRLVGAADTAELICLCEQWGLYRQTVELAKDNPTDKEIRCAVTAYFTAFDRLAAKFGLTTADRAGLKVPADSSRASAVPTRARA